MTKKFLKIILCITTVLCLLMNFSVAFAVNDETNEQPDNEIIFTPVEETQEKEPETTRPSDDTSKKDDAAEKTTVPSTTQKQTKPSEKNDKTDTTEKTTVEEVKTTRRQNTGNTGNGGTQTVNTAPQTTEETTEEPLPDGAFYVHLVLNNGKKELKTVMKKSGLVPEPTEPTREGYVFDGWYRDSEFKESWDFFTDTATEEITIYAKWVADPNTVAFKITVKQSEGGTIKTNPEKASEGEAVYITVTPDEGKRLAEGGLLINGKPSDVFSFVMPSSEVTVSAIFEDIPKSVSGGEEKSNLGIYIIAAAVLVIVVVCAVLFVLVKRKREEDIEFYDPDAPVTDEPDEDFWIDESIVIEDGFRGGKIVKKNSVPLYEYEQSDNETEYSDITEEPEESEEPEELGESHEYDFSPFESSDDEN